MRKIKQKVALPPQEPHKTKQKQIKEGQRKEGQRNEGQRNEGQRRPHKTARISKKDRIQAVRKQKIDQLRTRREEVKDKLAVAQVSTKSMGKFDRKAHKQQKTQKVQRRKQYVNFSSLSEQVSRNKQILESIKLKAIKQSDN